MFESQLFDDIVKPALQLQPIPNTTLSPYDIQNAKTKILSGLSNITYRVQVGSTIPFLAQVYMSGGDEFDLVDRVAANQICTLAGEAGIGPKVYFADSKLRLESFCEGKELTWKDLSLRVVRNETMLSLSTFHTLEPTFIPQTPIFQRVLTREVPILTLFENEKRRAMPNLKAEEKNTLNNMEKVLTNPETLSWLNELVAKRELVFSHNDFHTGNLIRKTEGKVAIIDYEYCGFNLRTYDIACLVNETPFDYEVAEPPFFHNKSERKVSKEDLKELLLVYLLFQELEDDLDEEELLSLAREPEIAITALREKIGKDETRLRLEDLEREYKLSSVLNHHFWSLWAVTKCSDMQIAFDYIEFGRQRTEMFLKDLQVLKDLE